MTPRDPRACVGCDRRRTDVFSRQIGDSYYTLCPTCADRRRATRTQHRASEPPTELPRSIRRRQMRGEARGD